jgi:uncharacterized membrane protein
MDTIDPAFILTFAAALGSGLVGGAFYAFSTFVMRALGTLPARDGLAAMQAINIAAVTPGFMLGFIGTALLTALALVTALLRWDGAASLAVVVGATLYLVGTFGLTIARNVPLNNALAPLDPVAPASAATWTAYLATWTAWNHARTVTALAATLAFTIALIVRAAQ